MSVHLYIFQKFDSKTKINFIWGELKTYFKATEFSLEKFISFLYSPQPHSVPPFRPVSPSIPITFILPLFCCLFPSKSPPQDHLLSNSCEKKKLKTSIMSMGSID